MIKGYGLDVAAGKIDPEVLFDMIPPPGQTRDLEPLPEISCARSRSRLAIPLIAAKQRGNTRVCLVSEEGRVVAKPAR